MPENAAEMPVRTPVAADTERVVQPMSANLVGVIAEARGYDGMSIRKIAAMLDLSSSRVQRCLDRPEVRAQVKEHRNRAKAAKRKRDQRAREAVAAESSDPIAARFGITTTPNRVARNGWLDLYRHAESGVWMRTASVGFDRPAVARDFERRGVPVPADLHTPHGFGPPGHDRPAVGHIPPEQRPVRMRYTNPRGVLVTSPVEARDVPAREAEGWELVEPDA